MLLLDGRKVSESRLDKLAKKITQLKAQFSRSPGLAVIRVGEDEASKVYVSNKIKACKKLGIISKEMHLPENILQIDLEKIIDDLNQDSEVHGILLQMPLPKHLNSQNLILSIDPNKDVDGFHPLNLGKLVSKQNGFVACTPKGILDLLEFYKVPIEGKRAVVVGRSLTVGRPVSLLLDQAGATVTVVHLGTLHPKDRMKEADILVVAAGQKELVHSSDVKDGVVVVDVGIHRKEDGKLVGDVHFESVKEKAAAISPVPGGVGPMTICALMENCVQSFEEFMRREIL